ncbi:hypothetical protein DID80_06240 [Candidatus Marinamargulisbacteria bacterium SCGC AAA071-K20]|nr:hypothetical protein DID80_06240 [Candidatus Marinamargulisbacteria bacterium SCGC AAA071-K20]
MGRPYLTLLLVVLVSFSSLNAATISQYMSNNRAISELEDEAYDESLGSFSKALGQGKDLGEIHQNIGHVYFKKKDYENAIVAYEKAMSKLKGQQKNDSLYNLGTSYFSKGDLETAKDTYINLLRDDPEHVNGKKNLEAVLTILKAQQHQQQQEQEKEKKEKRKKKKKKERPKNQEEKQKKKQEEKKNNAKQILNMLSEKEKEAREKHNKLPEQENFVEKEW